MKFKRAILFTTLAALLASAAMPASAARKRTRNTNTAPVISGTPSPSVQATFAYSFTPTASDAQNDTLTFYVSNKPAWASFSSSTGKLAGTPSATQAGTYSNISIRVSDGLKSSYLRNSPASVTVGNAYAFTPKASDADGNMLSFSVSNKPAWVVFSTATGSMTGSPTSAQAGTYSGIGISVSDGTSTASLPAFTITVNQAAVAGTAALSWSAPTQNTDGTALTDLAGFKVYHGTSATALNDVVELQGAAWSSYTYPQLAPGTHYFAVSAYTSAGAESTLSAVGSKLIQ